ncbi:histidine kinase dimerization/phospho-acceptor domain-containing protein [Ollibium composti]|uniref:histidine kinase n=1 Tax=Ollibium composti TaxID=2675109 RepID=A0ABY2QAE5_9HYPH|nr:histidine kinase dimerization/phospho-acceptor domain-containing protein [Mesorhizobium composti]THF58944.1 PAS domain S-box protein [Mesorhizobium composti]
MPSASYSFLDVVVLDAVRGRFAAGDALAILSAGLDDVLWANGPGAAVLGYANIEAAVGAATGLPPVARRQIMATAAYPDIGTDRAIALRLASGMTSRAVNFLASAVTMPDGEKAILLAVPAAHAASRDAAEIAAHAIGGFTEDGQFLAFVDGQGRIEAASEGFAALGITEQTLAGLVTEIAGQADRLLKRRIPAAGGSFPAGFARLCDDPARHLLVVVEEPEPASVCAPLAAESEAIPVDSVPTVEDAPAPVEEERQNSEPQAAAADDDVGEPPAVEAAEAHPEATDRSAAPVRFVWRTDAEGRFSAVSPEFAAAVGEPAAAIIGKRFGDVATAFGLDPSGEIAGLLERRDTWSGRTVLWPVAGTARGVPVDLAALPVYGKGRAFEGFRGFGVARVADARPDPAGRGLSLTESAANATDIGPAPETASTPDMPPQAGSHDPFQGEVPALAVEPKPDRRYSDKVIRLAEHRQPAANDKGSAGDKGSTGDKGTQTPERSLSSVERNAFREIGERLRREEQAGAETSEPEAVSDAANAAEVPAENEAPAEPAEAGSVPHHRALTPASEPGKLADGLPPATEEGTAALSEEPFDDDVQETDDVDDLARLDGVTPAEAEQAVTGRSGSLLDYAEEKAPAAGNGAGMDDDETGDDQPDSMAAADFADARDDESLPVRADEAGAPPQEPALPPQPRSPAPALRKEGFVPSAFSLAAGPDTSILAKLPVPLLIHSGDVLHYANDEFLRLSGYRSLAALADAGGLDGLFAAPYAEDSASDGTERQLRLRTSEGQEFPVEANLRSVPWRDGKALMLMLHRSQGGESRPAAPQAVQPAVVVTQPVQPDIAELKARISEMRTIIDTATDGVVLIAPDGTIRSISRPAEALFSFDSDEVAGKPFASLFAIESQRAARDYLAGLSEPGVASVLNDGREVIGREAQGRFIPLFMTIGRLPDDSGYCAVVRDITQWKRAEEDLTQARAVAERASSQKTDFLARISHEIRTPLNAIIGFSELMMDEKFGPVANDRYRDYLRDINRSGNHVLDLVNDLLDISKIEAGQQEMQYEAVSLNDTLAETVALMQPQANRERVIIRSSFASRLPDIVADLRSIRQIALNVLSNAIRYTQAGGQVIVSTAYETSGDVVMRVRDTGVGMTPAEIEQALKPFKQINALKRGRGDGTGLGLPLTKAMVEANRARFAIASTPGEGTLVEVVFPSTRVLAD